MGKSKLNLRQLKFVTEYVKDGNGAQAAIRAGYSKKIAKQIAFELISENPEVQRLVNELREKMVRDGEYNLQQAVKELDENIKMAQERGNMMAVSKMIETKIKIHGLLADVLHLRIEKVDVASALAKAEQRLLPQASIDVEYHDLSKEEKTS